MKTERNKKLKLDRSRTVICRCVFECMPAAVYGCAHVAVALPGCHWPFVQSWVMWICIFIPGFVLPSSSCSPVDLAPPRPICRILLIVDHKAMPLWPHPITRKLIAFLHHTSSQSGWSTKTFLTSYSKYKWYQLVLFSSQGLEVTPTISPTTTAVVLVASGSNSHGNGRP